MRCRLKMAFDYGTNMAGEAVCSEDSSVIHLAFIITTRLVPLTILM